MAFIAKNPLMMPEVKSSPSVPQTGTRGLYAGEDGWYEIDSNGRTKKITGAEGTGDLGRVYKYEMSCTWSLLQFGLIENYVEYPFEVGMVFNIEGDDVIPPEYSENGNEIKVLAGDNIAIASIIDNKPKFDKLSATVDLSNYVTKDEFNAKVSSVYKYKGTAPWNMLYYGFILGGFTDQFEIGDVWNIDEDAVLPAEYSNDGKEHIIVSGDNIAVVYKDANGIPKFDKLAGTIDLSNYVTKDEIADIDTGSKMVILSNTMTKDEIVSAINDAEKGTRFDIRSNLDLYDVNITFPEESVVYSSTGKKNISFGYSGESLNTDYYWQDSWYLSFGKFSKIYDLSVYFSDNATANVGVNFGEGCEVANCYFSGYEPCSWSSNCTFVNCSFGYYIYSLSIGGSYIKCHFDYTNEWSEGVDCSAVSLIDCSSTQFKINPQNGSKLIAKIKALNPDMNIIDAEGNEARGLYVTTDDIGDIESALDNIIAIQNSLIGGDV